MLNLNVEVSNENSLFLIQYLDEELVNYLFIFMKGKLTSFKQICLIENLFLAVFEEILNLTGLVFSLTLFLFNYDSSS